MKKKYLFIQGARKWNNLLKKFQKVYNRTKKHNLSTDEFSKLSAKLTRIYKRLEKMQSNVGLKLAGTSLVLMLSAVNTQAQNFTNSGFVKAYQPQGTTLPIVIGRSLDAADIDNDSDLDIIVGDYYGNVTMLINNGDDTFNIGDMLKADGSYIDVGDVATPKFADIDNDNDLDLYIGNNQGKIYIYSNDGLGNYTTNGFLQADGVDIDVTSSAAPEFSDNDNDGDLDLFVGCQDGTIKLYENDGSGNFSFIDNLQQAGTNIDVGFEAKPDFLDFDGDGDMDLFVANSSGKINFYLNNGSGIYSDNGFLQADGTDIDVGNEASSLFIDINSDGNPDLLVGSNYNNIKVYINDGSFNFSESTDLAAEGYYRIKKQEFTSPKYADVDNDGDLDLYLSDMSYIYVFENDGTGKMLFQDTLKVDGNNIDQMYPYIDFADIDNDGDLDIYIGDYYYGMSIFLNDGSGNFSDNGSFLADGNIVAYGSYRVHPEFADLDADGDLDFYLGEDNGTIEIYTNDGSGNFSANGLVQADGTDLDVTTYAGFDFADIDNDNDLDIISGNNSGHILLFTNDGANNFTSAGFIQADGIDIYDGTSTDVELIDLDGDGDLDIVAGEYYGFLRRYDNLLVTKVTEQATSQTNICVNNTVDFSIIAESADTYQWQFSNDGGNNYINISDDANYTGSNNNTLSVNAITTTEGLYRCVITNTNNTAQSDAVTLSLDTELPTISCIANQTIDLQTSETEYIVSGAEFDPTATNDNCAVASIENDFNTSASLDGALIPIGTTTVEWTVTDESGNTEVCSFEILVNSATGITELSDTYFNIYPNPAHNKLTISNDKLLINSAEILDITGKTVEQFTVNTKQYSVDISDLQNGIYFIKLQTNNLVKTIKVIKE